MVVPLERNRPEISTDLLKIGNKYNWFKFNVKQFKIPVSDNVLKKDSGSR